jgi:hypothetical protein
MAYDLENFCKDCHDSLAADPGTPGRRKVRDHVEKLLANPEFIAEHLGPDVPQGVNQLYQDPEFGFVVLAHSNRPNRNNTPHDHGSTWAVYGQAMNFSDMTEWRRTDDGAVDGHAELETVASYRLEAGEARFYDAGAIHSLSRPEETRLLRVTGVPIETLVRHRFDAEKQTVKDIAPNAG